MVKLEILFDQQTGQIRVNGPIGESMLCYGMLDMAKEIILRKSLEDRPTASSGLVIPQLGMQ